jgi:hypothetical protein
MVSIIPNGPTVVIMAAVVICLMREFRHVSKNGRVSVTSGEAR